MHDREFEKQVQQKMQELRFQPDADVWARVQADIRKKKRRRPILFLLLAALLGGSAWLYFGLNDQNKQSSLNNNIKASTGTSERNVDKTSDNNKNATSNDDADVTRTQPTNAKPNSITSTNKNNTLSNNTNSKTPKDAVDNNDDAYKKNAASNKYSGTSLIAGKKDKKITASRSPLQKQSAGKKQALPNDLSVSDPLQDDLKNKITKDNTRQQPIPGKIADDKTVTADNTIIDSAAKKQQASTADSVDTKPAGEPKVSQPQQPISKTADSIVLKPFGAKKKADRKGNNWEWGFTAGAGFSNLGRELFQTQKIADALNAPPSMPRPDSSAFSNAKSGLAFHVGGYVSKSISKSLRLKLGLNYDHYSNRVPVGQHVGNARYVNQSGGLMNLVADYYTPGDDNVYTNSYHYISVPVNLQWLLRKNKKPGLIWENGIAASWIAATNALHYDGISRTYYKDNSLFNDMQWIASSSLMVGFKVKQNKQLYVGPQIQYGITSVVKEEANQNTHLRSAGVKMMMNLNKK
ncbi:MAG: hypothetical protein WCF67_19710 [Chitinophagaceae bacterium]